MTNLRITVLRKESKGRKFLVKLDDSILCNRNLGLQITEFRVAGLSRRGTWLRVLSSLQNCRVY